MMKFIILFIIIVSTASGAIWFLNESNQLEVTYHRLEWAEKSNDQLRISQLSDLHVSGDSKIEESVIQAINKENPDILLLTGDMVDRPTKLSALDSFLGRLVGGAARFAILGNWEYWSGLDIRMLRQIYTRHRITLLINDSVLLQKETKRLLLVGLDDALAGKPDWNAALASHRNWTGPTLVLAHNPITIEHLGSTLRPDLSGLALAGHTHGGQIVLFGVPIETSTRHATCLAGWCQKGGWSLYVSRGIGTSIVPLRLGARPELPMLTWMW
ncbi:MAG: metallophosphoesterase [Magnetococcales bacterium]|nr:metallophosphoesterase [Magnetococcales bacterium]